MQPTWKAILSPTLQGDFFLCGLLPPKVAPINTMMTITIASAMIPVVSAETGTGVGTGVWVMLALFLVLLWVVAVGVAEAARAESKVCIIPTRKVTATRTRIKIIRERGI